MKEFFKRNWQNCLSILVAVICFVAMTVRLSLDPMKCKERYSISIPAVYADTATVVVEKSEKSVVLVPSDSITVIPLNEKEPVKILARDIKIKFDPKIEKPQIKIEKKFVGETGIFLEDKKVGIPKYIAIITVRDPKMLYDLIGWQVVELE